MKVHAWVALGTGLAFFIVPQLLHRAYAESESQLVVEPIAATGAAPAIDREPLYGPDDSDVLVSDSTGGTSSANVSDGGDDSGGGPQSSEKVSKLITNEDGEADEEYGDFSANYFGIFYGPSLKNMTSYQPTQNGRPDPTRPVLMKNFVQLAYDVSDVVTVAADGFWLWIPVQGQDIQVQDPFIKISHSSIMNNGNGFNLYGDMRIHLPVTATSQTNDLKGGFQTVQVASYEVPNSNLTLAVYGSERVNVFGPLGYGNDLELYIGPNASYRLRENLALTLLYELNGIHIFGDPPFVIRNNGADIEPGFEWDVTKRVSVNPYLNFMTSAQVSGVSNVSVGFMFNWRMI